MKTTSEIRVSHLTDLSEKIYPIIDQEIDGETRARRIVRLGIQTVATVLNAPDRFPRSAGDYYHALLLRELFDGGLDEKDYAAWPHYRSVIEQLPYVPELSIDHQLDDLACTYADVRRKTISANGQDETDASHAAHLGALMLPYAAEYYPDLNQGNSATYGLIHDIAEAYAGDTPSLGMSKAVEQQKNDREAAALERITSEFSVTHPQLVRTIPDYEALNDPEARYTKTFDKLDPGFTHFTNNGYALHKHHGLTSSDVFLAMVDGITQRVQVYGSDFPDLLADRITLTSRVDQVAPWNHTATYQS